MSLDKARYRFLSLLLMLAAGAGLLALAYSQIEEALAYKLPTEKISFDKSRPPSAKELLDRDGKVLDYWYGERLRFYVPLSRIDSKLVDFVVLSEDAKFFQHSGFDVSEIKNSLEKNFESGKIKRGASTITQQLVKNLYLDKERSFTRKLFEIPWALRVEKDLSKKQILELYLNIIEWGPGIYGAEAASRHFFDREAASLSVGQALYLTLIIPNPNRFDVFAHPKTETFLEKKRNDFVSRLVSEKKIKPEEKEHYLSDPFALVSPDYPTRRFPARHQASYFGSRTKKAEWLKDVEKQLKESLSKKPKAQVSLDFYLQQELMEAELLPVETMDPKSSGYVLIKENDQIRSFRKVGKGMDLSEEFKTKLSERGLQAEVAPQIPWKSLAL